MKHNQKIRRNIAFLVSLTKEYEQQGPDLFLPTGERRTGARHRNAFWAGFDGDAIYLRGIGSGTLADAAAAAGKQSARKDQGFDIVIG